MDQKCLTKSWCVSTPSLLCPNNPVLNKKGAEIGNPILAMRKVGGDDPSNYT